MERCGLRFVRTFHLEWDDPIEGTEHGEVEYEITKAEWKSDESRVTTLRVVNSDKDPANKPQTPAPKSTDGPKEAQKTRPSRRPSTRPTRPTRVRSASARVSFVFRADPASVTVSGSLCVSSQ